MRRTLIAVGLLFAAGHALVVGYKVEPVCAQWSGKADPNPQTGGVGQTVCCNFDSVVYCELFVGDRGANPSNRYVADVYEEGVSEPVATSGEVLADKDHAWLRMNLTTESGYKFTKGKTLSFRFTRGGSDSIQYYYQDNDPYQFGDIVIPGEGNHPMRDLCMRVYGVLDPVDSSYWGMNPAFNDWDVGTLKQRWIARARGAGVGAVRCPVTWYWAQLNSPGDSFYFGNTDSSYTYMHDSAGCEVMNLLFLTPPWASTRIDSLWTWVPDTANEGFWEFAGLDTSENCPPINLFEPVSSTANYWARFVEAAVRKYPDVRLVELWNESNDGCTTKVPGVDGWWRRPNRFYHPDTFAGNRGLCSLYMRLCEVATTVIKGEHPGHKVFIGALARVNDANPGQNLIAGREWLELCYSIGTRGNTVRPFWDGVTVHPYQPGAAFDDARFAADAETLRAIMRENGHGDGELRITEVGWDTAVGPEVQADNIGKVYVGAKASDAEVKTRYDGLYWFMFRDFGFRHGLLDSLMISPRASYHAFSHARSALTGKRVNGRVLSGGAGLDTQAYAYEFEDPAYGRRTWVTWRSDGGEAEVALPCRVDSLATTELAYGPSTDVRAAAAGADGWFKTRVGARPVFAREPATARISRPDLVVDSIRVTTAAPQAGERLDAVAFLRNVGTRTTPAGLPVVVTLSLDGTEVGRAAVRSRILAAASITVSVRLPAGAAGSRLLSAVANPDARFVELDADNNAAYAPVTILPRTR